MISIVMAYYNRLPHLCSTLRSIERSAIKDVEIVIVDDASDQRHSLSSVNADFPNLNILIHRVEKADKWYINPCVVYNKAVSISTGDIILIQNPECAHVGDVLTTCSSITDGDYISFACYSLSAEQTTKFQQSNVHPVLINARPSTEGGEGWYNHPSYRPSGYHFASCITRSNFNKLNGFDERYATGVGYDDDEFVYRVKLLGLTPNIVTSPLVYHQNHYVKNGVPNSEHWPTPGNDNKQQYQLTVTENKIRAN